jgi:hypothetical protein
MFDYQAGEKFKLTLIMVGFAGLMAGMFFSMLLMPGGEQPHKQQRRGHHVKWTGSPDETGMPSARASKRSAEAASENSPQAAPVTMVNAADALNLVSTWLPYAWDLSAGSARKSQEQAISCMTPDCAQAYRQNVWREDVAKQIEDAGLQSSFSAEKVYAGSPQADGSIVIYVEGMQKMTVPNKGTQEKPKKLEYLVKSTAEGLRIAGISDGGQQS